MNKKVLLICLSLLLCGCEENNSTNSISSPNSDNTIVSIDDKTSNIPTSISDGTSEKSNNITTIPSTPTPVSNVPNTGSSSSFYSSAKQNPIGVPTNTPYDIANWKSFAFYDGDSSKHNSDFTYYYGTSINPSGVVRGDKYGVDLCDRNQGLVSPLFNTWEKVEINITLRFVPRSSTKYKPTNNQPQLKVVQYNDSGTQLDVEDVYIQKSQVPSDDKNYYTLKLDVYNNQMSYFDLKYNNSVAKGNNSGYTYAIHEINIKGWPYGK